MASDGRYGGAHLIMAFIGGAVAGAAVGAAVAWLGTSPQARESRERMAEMARAARDRAARLPGALREAGGRAAGAARDAFEEALRDEPARGDNA